MTESRIYLLKGAALVEASLFDEVTDQHLAAWNDSWNPAMEKFSNEHMPSGKPEDAHWDWKLKANEWQLLLG